EGHFDEALAAYTSLTRSSDRFRTPVAWCLMSVGRSAEAIPLLQEAIRLDRGETERFVMYNALGMALIRVGRNDEAIKWLRAAKQESSGSSPQISWNLSIAYAHAGLIADARRELQQFQRATHYVDTARRLRHIVWTTHSGSRTPPTVEERAREIAG